jgi:hypothetical protein
MNLTEHGQSPDIWPVAQLETAGTADAPSSALRFAENESTALVDITERVDNLAVRGP